MQGLITSYTMNIFPDNYIPTGILDHASTIETVRRLGKSHKIELSIWDTAGQEDYDRLRPLSYPQTDIFLLCYSIESQSSYNNIKTKWVDEIKSHMPDTPFLLVGTKIDLRNENSLQEIDGYNLAKDVGAQEYVECSALTQEKLKQVFDAAVTYIDLDHDATKSKCCILL